jgi:hypothetical protein
MDRRIRFQLATKRWFGNARLASTIKAGCWSDLYRARNKQFTRGTAAHSEIAA